VVSNFRLSESSVARIRLRIENLSDLVFGLALSIGSIVLISKLPQTPTDLLTGIALFGFSFLLIVWIWAGYSTTMMFMPAESTGNFLLNVMLLFCVAVEPYLFYVQSEAQPSPSLLEFASSVYALDVGGMLFVLAGLIHVLLSEEKKRGSHSLPPARLTRFRRTMLAQAAMGAVFMASAVPVFWIPVPTGQFLTNYLWYGAIIVLLVVPRVGGRAPSASHTMEKRME
jgi:uncharacterized membrane protein